MSLINHTNKFIFIHIPKAAGTSVTKFLSEFTEYRDLELGGTQFGEAIQPAYFNRFGLYKHAPASRVKVVMGDVDWNSYYSFSFVRSPYDRVISVYKFLRQWDGCPKPIKDIMLGFNDVNEYVLSDTWEMTNGPDEIFRTQAYWISDPDDYNQLLIDKFYKVEEIEKGFLDILSKINQPRENIVAPVLNTSSSKSDIILNEDSIKKIEHKYAIDFKLFGYKMISYENKNK